MELQIILDIDPLIGRSRHSADSALENQKKFGSLRAKQVYVRKAVESGFSGFLCSYDRRLLRSLKKETRIFPLVPNSSQYVRDMNSYGLVMMGVRKVLQLGFDILTLTPTVFRNALGLLRKDFSSITLLLTALEMVKFKKFKPQITFLHPQMTDLFLANGNPDPIKKYAGFVRERYKSEPGLFTNNIAQLLEKLSDWNLDIRQICTPINPLGYLMKPDQKKAEEKIRGSSRSIIGYDVTCGGTVDLSKSLAYCRALNVRTVVIELPDLPTP
jgi:hypothetical protein